MLEKWKNAVIHLECATDSEHYLDKLDKWYELADKRESGEISDDEWQEKAIQIFNESNKDIRYQGTAVFLSHNSRRYLLTARHVIWDEDSAEKEFQIEKKEILSWPEHMQEDMLKSAEKKKLNKIFSNIFRVPSLNEILSNKKIPESLVSLGAGTEDMAPYIFSAPEYDLAIISLDQIDRLTTRFVDELLELGYEPISLEDIANEPTKEGTDVFTVGFPTAVSSMGPLKKTYAESLWSSRYFSLPTFTFGKISMLNEGLSFFWTDMSIYPGNSGGPVIENNKLVGIVHGQPIEEKKSNLELIEDMPKHVRDVIKTVVIDIPLPFGKIIKAKYLFDLIKEQEKKDNFAIQLLNRSDFPTD